jgi:hypothetical protein
MIKHFEPMLASTLSFKDNVIYIIASRGDSTPILNKHLKIFTVSRSDGNSSVWRDDAKNYVKYNSLLTRKENIQHLEGIENGKIRLSISNQSKTLISTLPPAFNTKSLTI